MEENKGNSFHTAKVYKSVAEKLLKQIEAPHENSPIGKLVVEYAAKKKLTNEGMTALLTTPKASGELIAYIIRGYSSLRSLITALNEANRDALAEEEPAAPEEPEAEDEDGEENSEGKSGEQLTFIDELFDHVKAMRRIRRMQNFTEMPKDKLKAFGEQLMREAKEILLIAKNKKD